MIKKIVTLVLVSAVASVLVCNVIGCKKKTEPAAEEVKTAEEYKAEAEKEITEENMEQSLSDIEKNMEAETTE
jgi:hypothetical protein